MIGQTIAIFVDAYRDLNARKLFWITLILSAAVVLGFASLGADDRGLKIFKLRMDIGDGLVWYNVAFQKIVIGLWLTWAATILALISTAGMFPDLISGGSIDLYVSKPIGRPRLFLSKYLAGLIFVSVQVLVVALGSYLVLGLRVGEWKPRLFLAVPIVVCFFSYLFAICVLLGVVTRSTIAALLLTLLCWTFLAVVDWSEPGALLWRRMSESQATQQREEVATSERALHEAESDKSAAAMVPILRSNVDSAKRQADSAENSANWMRTIHRALYVFKTVTPKTSDTIDYLNQIVFTSPEETEPASARERERRVDARPHTAQQDEQIASVRASVHELQSRSPFWIIGTSLAFEAVLVGGAMWIFCRRDY